MVWFLGCDSWILFVSTGGADLEVFLGSGFPKGRSEMMIPGHNTYLGGELRKQGRQQGMRLGRKETPYMVCSWEGYFHGQQGLSPPRDPLGNCATPLRVALLRGVERGVIHQLLFLAVETHSDSLNLPAPLV